MSARQSASGPEHDLLDAALERLLEGREREGRGGLEVDVVEREHELRGMGSGFEVDAKIKLRHPSKTSPVTFLVEVKRTHLSYALVDGVIARYATIGQPWLLCAPYVAPPMSRYLSQRGISFIDATGNCHLEIDGNEVLHHAETARRPSEHLPTQQSVRAPGYKVIHALLAKPELLGQSVRNIELDTGATKSTINNQLRRLEAEGILARARGQLALVRPRALFDKWVAGYADVLRPWLLVGRYETPIRDANELEAEIEREFAADERWWWWGGASAAWRMTKHYRAPTTTLHVDDMPKDALKRVRALPSAHGTLEILRFPNCLALGKAREEKLHVVDPLLVYAELMSSPDERAREAAATVRERFIAEYS